MVPEGRGPDVREFESAPLPQAAGEEKAELVEPKIDGLSTSSPHARRQSSVVGDARRDGEVARHWPTAYDRRHLLTSQGRDVPDLGGARRDLGVARCLEDERGARQGVASRSSPIRVMPRLACRASLRPQDHRDAAAALPAPGANCTA